jgi:peptide/nickel transport system substrate-binding protein
MPKEIVERTTHRDQIVQPVGTGPYRLVEHQRDGYVTVARHEKYAGNGDRPDGSGGKKNAYVDEIRFITVPDQAVRVAGVQSGEYDYAEGISINQHSALKENGAVTTLVGTPSKSPAHFLNLRSEVTSDRKLRQAMLAALDPEAALRAAWGTTGLYRLNGALMAKESLWHTEAGTANYNQRNLERAKSLLKESDYAGEPIRYLTTREYPSMYLEATAIAQQFQVLGLNVKLEVIDWASLVSRRAKREEWEVFSTWHGLVHDPALLEWNNSSYPGWWTNETVDGLRDGLFTTLDPAERRALLERLQAQLYEVVPLLKLGDVADLYLTSPRLKDVGTLPHTMFWNAYLTR